MLTYTLKVLEIRKETVDTVTICFKQPGLKKITYLPGQYISLIFRINGRRYIRPYSFSSAPGADSLLEVTVKRVPGGTVSNHINDQLQVNDLVEVMKPMGEFVFDKTLIPANKHIMLWGAGSGITPLISIAKYIVHFNTGNKVTLAYGNRNSENVIFLDKINQMAADNPDTFSARHFHTQLAIDKNNTTIVQGRISSERVIALVQEQGGAKDTIHYICGPTGLKESVVAALRNLSVPETDIYTEDFEIVKNPADFFDIYSQNISLTLNQTKYNVEVIKGKSILEAGLDASLEMPYSCQTGNCSVCKGTLLQGKLKTIGVEKLPADLAENEYLLCCSYPLTGDVSVEIV